MKIYFFEERLFCKDAFAKSLQHFAKRKVSLKKTKHSAEKTKHVEQQQIEETTHAELAEKQTF